MLMQILVQTFIVIFHKAFLPRISNLLMFVQVQWSVLSFFFSKLA